MKLSILFPDGVGAHKLKLFQGKFIKLVLHFPDVGLLQLCCCLFGGGLFLSGLSQVRLFTSSKIKTVDVQSYCEISVPALPLLCAGTCFVEFGGSFEKPR